MNGISKESLVKNLCRLAANLCAYVRQPCDCKFMQDKDENIANGSESGSGCPEISVAATMLAHMSKQEFLALARKAGVTVDDEDRTVPDVYGMIRQFQEERMDKKGSQAQQVANQIRKKHRSAYVPGKLPKGVL
jgi:hypothetical protein